MVDVRLKSSWPEVVGWNALAAGIKIHADRPDIVCFELHYVGDHVPRNHDVQRVRIFLTPGTYTIALTPVAG